jgi:hypothetical protein
MTMSDEPTVLHPVVRKLEEEAIALYRAKYPDGIPWQELADITRNMWVAHAERKREKEPQPVPQSEQKPPICST